jgi:hypothetical protein
VSGRESDFEFLYNFFTVLDYDKTMDKWCEANVNGKYSDLLDAQIACDERTDCYAFYDTKSDNKSFVLCGSPPLMQRSDYFRSRLYTKCRILIQGFIRSYHEFVLYKKNMT